MKRTPNAAPRSRPIIMTGPSVPAISAGVKTQTRRLVKLPDGHGGVVIEPGGAIFGPGPYLKVYRGDPSDGALMQPRLRCPYGYPGDRLVVLETWRTEERASDSVDGIRFAADDAFVPIENSREAADRWIAVHDNGRYGTRWRSPIHMPRWASRLTLELVEVRAQRLQEISEADALAEGMRPGDAGDADLGGTARGAFHRRWDELNGHRRRREYLQLGDPRAARGRPWRTVIDESASWAANPWIWALTFRRLP